jgi:hypothetical protein
MQEMQASKGASQLVEGLTYPASKAEVLEAARDADLEAVVRDALDKLPDREFQDAEDLTQALNAS